MKRILSIFTFLCFYVFTSSVTAQSELWITGTAVPGGVQKLNGDGNGGFKFAGQLKAGELRIQTTKKTGWDTRFLSPVLPDALIANKGLHYSETSEKGAAAWQVPFDEDRYRFAIDPMNRMLRGEIFQPWGELFIAGGATEVGWRCEGRMLPMQQDEDNPCLWTWEGELKRRPENEEPTSFKFQGQDRWSPKSLHPYRQGTDILKDQQLRTGGEDTKWEVGQDGRYRIAIDLFHETVKAELLK